MLTTYILSVRMWWQDDYVSEVIDCWFDSGAMLFAQYHYPFENKEFFESHYPCQFISEALDQTRVGSTPFAIIRFFRKESF